MRRSAVLIGPSGPIYLNETTSGRTAALAGITVTELAPAVGSKNATLDDFTTAAAGRLAITAHVGATLDDFTKSATGQLQITASRSATLDDFTGAATGALAISGGASVTLDDFAKSATGRLAINGSRTATLDDFVGAAAGRLAIAGASSNTLDDFTKAAIGRLGIAGARSATLDDFTAAAAGTLAIHGTGQFTLDDFEKIATGRLAIRGARAVTLDDFTVSATGGNLIQGERHATLDDFKSGAISVDHIQALVRANAVLFRDMGALRGYITPFLYGAADDPKSFDRFGRPATDPEHGQLGYYPVEFKPGVITYMPGAARELAFVTPSVIYRTYELNRFHDLAPVEGSAAPMIAVIPIFDGNPGVVLTQHQSHIIPRGDAPRFHAVAELIGSNIKISINWN